MSGTARACRAIIAARELDPALGEAALRALQLMHFTTPRLLDNDEDLRAALAGVPGLDADAVVAGIDDPAIVAAYQADRALARSAEGSPTHAQDRFSTSDGPVRYTAPSVIFEDERGHRLEVASSPSRRTTPPLRTSRSASSGAPRPATRSRHFRSSRTASRPPSWRACCVRATSWMRISRRRRPSSPCWPRRAPRRASRRAAMRSGGRR
jgi:hypothetical protein